MINQRYNLPERPILFQRSMVQANHANEKSETRRLVKGDPLDLVTMIGADNNPTGEYGFCSSPLVIEKHIKCPYGMAGDLLWVRETHRWHEDELGTIVQYRAHADDKNTPDELIDKRWTPSIHMKRKNSRTLLRVMDVNAERLHEMTPEDALEEGIIAVPHMDFFMDYGSYLEWLDAPVSSCLGTYDNLIFKCPLEAYKALWNRINGEGSWDKNPYVWVVKYKEIENV